MARRSLPRPAGAHRLQRPDVPERAAETDCPRNAPCTVTFERNKEASASVFDTKVELVSATNTSVDGVPSPEEQSPTRNKTRLKPLFT